MILPTILYTLKGKLLLGFTAVFTTIALTEVFLGQLIIAVTVALIGAIPTTAAVIIMARKQSAERAAGNKQILVAVDGQTTKLVQATANFSHLAGKEEERTQERDRQGAAAIAKQESEPAEVIQVNPPENPAIVKVTK